MLMNRATRALAGIAIAGAALAMNVSPAAANTGNVSAAEDCQSWHASVALSHNVTADRAVDVISTIPGVAGFTNHHYNTSFGEIWTANGQSPKHGTVTLNIYYPNGQLEFTDHKTLTEVEGCELPTSTTTVGAASSTTLPTATTAASVAPSPTCTEGRGCCLSECNGPTSATNAGELPKTGASSLPFAFAGIVSFASGIALLISFRKRAS